jgi:hypothetical protein
MREGGGTSILEWVALGSAKDECDKVDGVILDAVGGGGGWVGECAGIWRGGIKGASWAAEDSMCDDEVAKGNWVSWSTTSLEIYMQPDFVW